jgi:glycosyltransferase involved in cell wall biosynthesis
MDFEKIIEDIAISNGIVINLCRASMSKPNNLNKPDINLVEIKKQLREKLKEKTISIIVFVATYNEEKLVKTCLKSIRYSIRQSDLADTTKIILLDSNSTDGTTKIASKYVDKIINCPKGKLNARHYGYINEECDIVICADADRQYMPEWFDSLVKPLIDKNDVVASVGSPNDKDYSMYKLLVEKYKLPFNGGNSAFIRQCYLQYPFDLTVNQFDINDIWFEEEFILGTNLQKLGKIKYATHAKYNDLRNDDIISSVLRFFGRPKRTF